MPQDNERNKEVNSLFPSWLKASIDIWSNLAQAIPKAEDAGTKPQPGANNRFAEQWQKNLNSMKIFSQVMREPGSAAATVKAINTLPEIILKMAKSGWEASSQMQQHLLEKAGKIGQRTEAYNFDNLDQEVFKTVTDIYEKELRKYFHIPQLGLTRFYQERFNNLLDKQNLLETTLAEFLSVLSLPIEKSFKVLQENLQKMAQEGNMPKETKEHYAMWVKILEGHYMTLFKSQEYVDGLHSTISKLEDYVLAKNDIMQDLLQFFPVPTNKEMDVLYKEFHLLKNRVKELEKKVKYD
jgi:polyhydroxyalkanoate synthesis regulator phasin